MRIVIGFLMSALIALTVMFSNPAIAQNQQQFGDQSFNEYEAYLHPAQEPDTKLTTSARGYGRLKFPVNLSSGSVEVQLSGIDPAKVTAFHIHCGTPGVLGPIIVNFGQYGDFQKTIANDHFSANVTNDKLTFVKQPPIPPNLFSGKFTLPLPEGCPSDINFPVQQVNTVAGLDALARKGALYFNLHTVGHEFFGELRGQIYPVAPKVASSK